MEFVGHFSHKKKQRVKNEASAERSVLADGSSSLTVVNDKSVWIPLHSCRGVPLEIFDQYFVKFLVPKQLLAPRLLVEQKRNILYRCQALERKSVRPRVKLKICSSLFKESYCNKKKKMILNS